MAYEQHMKYVIDYEANKQSLNKLKQQLQELSNLTSPAYGKLNNMSIKEAYKELTKIRENIVTVENALARAFNPKINTVNIQKFKEELASSGLTLTQIRQSFNKMGAEGKQAYISLQSQIFKTNKALKETPKFLSKIGQTFTNVVSWNLSSAAINTVVGSIQKAWGFAKELDSSLNDIRIVTGQSASEMAKFANQANKAAQQLGRTTTDYTNASLIFAQQGLNEKERKAKTQITLKAANVTGQSAQQVSEELTAVWNGYKATAEQAEIYVDRLTAVAAHSASNLQELSTGMSKVAAAAASLGVGEDQLAAQLATIISVTRQAPETVGTALKTVYARITDIKAGIEEDGTTLGMYSEKLAGMGINVLDTAGNLRNMGEVIEEVGGKWEKFSKEQQIYIAQTMAGQRQYSNLVSLFDNFDKYNDAMKVAGEAAGTLQKQQEIYMESTDAKLQKIQNTLEKTFNTIMDSSAIKTLLDFLNSLAGVLSDVVNALGGSGGLLSIIGVLGTSAIVNKGSEFLSSTIKNFKDAKYAASDLKDKIKEINQQLKEDEGRENGDPKKFTAAQREYLKNQKEIYSMQQRYQGIISTDDIKKLQENNKQLSETQQSIENIKNARTEAIEEIIKKGSLFLPKKDFSIGENQHNNAADLVRFSQEDFLKHYKLEGEPNSLKNVINQRFSNIQENLQQLLDMNFDEFLSTSQGSFDSTILFSEDLKDRVNKMFTEQVKRARSSGKGQTDLKETLNRAIDNSLESDDIKGFLKFLVSTSSANDTNIFIDKNGQFKFKPSNLNNQIQKYNEAQQRKFSFESKKTKIANLVQDSELKEQTKSNLLKQLIENTFNDEDLKNFTTNFRNEILNAKTNVEEFEKKFKEAMDAMPEQQEKFKKELELWKQRKEESIANEALINSISQVIKGVAELSFGLSQAGKNLKEVTTGIADLISHGGDLKDLTAIASTAVSSGVSLYQGWKNFSKGIKGLQDRYDKKLIKDGKLRITQDENGNIVREYINLKTGKIKKQGQQIKGFAAKAGAVATGISIAAAVVNTYNEFSKIRNDQIQKQIEANNKLIENERKKQQELKNEQDVVQTVQSLNKQYQEGTISAVELRNKTRELQQQYKYSSKTISDLVSNYNDLNNALLKTKKIINQQLIDSKTEEVNLLRTNVSMQNEGKNFNSAGLFQNTNYVLETANMMGRTTFAAGILDSESNRLGNILKGKGLGDNIQQFGGNIGVYLKDAKNSSEAYQQFKALQFYINSTIEEQKNTATYKQAVQYYQQMKPMIEEWKTASLEKLDAIAQGAVLTQASQFSGVKSFKDYVYAYTNAASVAYNKLLTEEQFNSHMTTQERQNMLWSNVESVIPDDLKNKYGIKQDLVNKILSTVGINDKIFGVNEKQIKLIDDYIELIDQIPQEKITKIKIDFDSLQGLGAVGEQLLILKNASFTPLHWSDADSEAAAKRQNNINNVIEKMQSNKGMSKTQFEEWVPENLRDNFRYAGTRGYILKQGASALSQQEMIQKLQLQGFKGEAGGYGGQLESLLQAEKIVEAINNSQNLQTLFSDDTKKNLFNIDFTKMTKDQKEQIKSSIDQILNFAEEQNLGQQQLIFQRIKSLIESNHGVLTQQMYAQIQASYNSLKMSIDAINKDLENEPQIIREIFSNLHEFQIPIDKDIDLTVYKTLGKQFQILGGKEAQLTSEGGKLNAALKDNAYSAQQLAESILRWNSAITDVLPNYSKWMDILSTGGFAEQIELLPQLQDAYGDLFNIVGTALPEDFLTSVENLNLMYQALQGVNGAYDELRKKLIENITSSFTEEGADAFRTFEEWITESLKGKEIGEELDLEQFKEKLQALINITGLTADQINLILANIGKNGIATNISLDENGKINLDYATIGFSGKDKYDLGEHKSEQELARDRLKNQKELTKYLKEQADLYHNINIELKQMQKEYSKLQKKQSGLMGIELLQNLRAQNKALDDQNKKLEAKQKIEENDIQRQQQRLAGMGVSFDANGNISNYNAMFDAYQGSVNEVISQIRALENRQNQLVDLNQTDSDQYKNIDANLSALNREKNQRNEDFNDFKDYVSKYDSLIDQHYETMDAIEENASKQISLNLQEFQAKVQIKLDLKQAEVDWNNFVNDVLNREDILNPNATKRNQNIVKTAKDNNTNYIDMVNEQYSSFLVYKHEAEEFEKARKQGREYESKYFHSESEAIAAMEESAEKLKDLTSNSAENIDKIKQAILDEYAEIGQVFSVNDARYEFINEQLGHDKNLIDLMEGARGGRSKDRFYTQIAENNTSRVQSLKAQADFWKSQMNDENEAVRKMAEENWKATIQSLNQATEQGLNNLKEKYENMIDTIGQEFEDSITNGHGFDYFEMEWGAIKERSEMYLDSVNSAFAIKNTQFLYQKAINDASGLKTQQQLKKVMNEQLNILKSKDKLTKYDVDRAQKVLEVEKARLALEEVRNNKTALRLKRDSSGNYSYQFTADQQAIDEAQNKLDKAKNDLYNFDLDAFYSNTEKAIAVYKDAQAKIEEIWKNQQLSREQKLERIALIQQQAEQKMTFYTGQNVNIRANLQQSAFDSLSDTFDKSEMDFEKMIYGWNSDSQSFIQKFAGPNADNVKQQFKNAIDEMSRATQQYKNDTNQYLTDAGEDYQKLKNEGIDPVVESEQKAIDNVDTLMQKINTMVSNIETWKTDLGNLASGFDAIAIKATEATGAINTFKTSLGLDSKDSDQKNNNEDNKNNGNTGGSLASQVLKGDFSGLIDLSTTNSNKKSWIEPLPKVSGNNNGDNGGNGNGGNEKTLASLVPNDKEYVTGIDNQDRANFLHALFSQFIPASIDLEKVPGLIAELFPNQSLNFDRMTYFFKALGNNFGGKNKNLMDQPYSQLRSNIITHLKFGHSNENIEDFYEKNIQGPLSTMWGAHKNSPFLNLNEAGDISIEKRNIQFYLQNMAQKWNSDTFRELLHEYVNNVLLKGYGSYQPRLRPLKDVLGFDTGGYTGAWDSSAGKLAVLHEKELVLNKEDTKNMLDMLKITRDNAEKMSSMVEYNTILQNITDNLNDLVQLTTIGQLQQKMALTMDSAKKDADKVSLAQLEKQQAFEQQVKIEANFPNVNSKEEIEQAFADLTNLAVQKAMNLNKK